jgi:hypothetical protein
VLPLLTVPAADVYAPPLIEYCPPAIDIATAVEIPDTVMIFEVTVVFGATPVRSVKKKGVGVGTVPIFAEHEAVAPPFDPVQLHDHGPLPLTKVDDPALQRLAVGADVNVPPFDAPQVPFMGLVVNVADIVQLAVMGFVV